VTTELLSPGTVVELTARLDLTGAGYATTMGTVVAVADQYLAVEPDNGRVVVVPWSNVVYVTVKGGAA
jgi:hypothetical protein